jgi:DNA-binding transcriptional LysR family regulator
MMPSLKQLRYFATIAEFGKVAGAAKVLHISQPALSAALAQLEEIWDTQLFIRHKAQGVTLTADGKSLLRHSKQLLQQADSLEDYVRGLNKQVSGEIRIGCFATLGPLVIPRLLQQAREQYPELSILVTEANLVKLDDYLLNGDLELALSYGLDKDKRIHSEALADCPPYVLLSATHPLGTFDSLSLKQLCKEPMVLLDLPHSGDYFLSLFNENGCQPEIAYRSRSFEMVRCMVAAGLGFSLLNQRPKIDVSYNGDALKAVPLRSGQAKPLQVVIRRSAELQPSVRAEAVMALLKQIVTTHQRE